MNSQPNRRLVWEQISAYAWAYWNSEGSSSVNLKAHEETWNKKASRKYREQDKRVQATFMYMSYSTEWMLATYFIKTYSFSILYPRSSIVYRVNECFVCTHSNPIMCKILTMCVLCLYNSRDLEPITVSYNMYTPWHTWVCICHRNMGYTTYLSRTVCSRT